MRIESNSILVAANVDSNETLKKCWVQLNVDLALLQGKLNQLRKKLINSIDNLSDATETLEDSGTLETQINTLTTYLKKIECTNKCSFKFNKMSEKDIAVLEQQALVIRKMSTVLGFQKTAARDEGTVPANPPTDKLSELIHDAAKMEYDVSYKRIWLRRGILLLGGLLAVAAAVTTVCILMTPGVNIAAAAVMIPVTIKSVLAFFYMCKPAVVTTAINMGGYPVTVAANVPSTLGVPAAGIMGLSLFSKLRVTNPEREEAARNMQAATMNALTDRLNSKIRALKDGDVKNFLASVVKQADKMYNAGVGSRFHESQSSKMYKARIILRETAKIIERENIPSSVKDLLEIKINDGKTYAQIINLQRNSGFFDNRLSNFADKLIKEHELSPQLFKGNQLVYARS